jgi:hypothetical protein
MMGCHCSPTFIGGKPKISHKITTNVLYADVVEDQQIRATAR